MEQERYQQQYKAFVQQAEQRLNELCNVYLPVKAQISQAARYSLLGGGKRVRAVLVLAACQLAGGDTAAAADYAAALEMLHCYSLIQLCGGFAGVRLLWPAGGHGRWCGH